MTTPKVIKRIATGSLAALLIIFTPAPVPFARAEESGDEPPACPAYAGTTKPTGAAAVTYSFNKETCLWENDYYTWSPETKEYTRRTAHDYVYIPASGKWVKVVPPEPEPAPTPQKAPESSEQTTTPQSSNAVEEEAEYGVDLDSTTTASINNSITGIALSGNAYVGSNLTGGNATSGNATSMANVINMLQSSSGFGGEVATFSTDINGDVYGDLFLDPALLTDLQGAGDYSYSRDMDIDINEQVNGSIANDIDLDAQSGDATVHSNTNAGDAKTGSANAVLNLVNMINSAISSGQSFLGVLNIYGNLNGDILLPPKVLDQVIANNAPQSQIDSSTIENVDVLADFTNNQTITNDIDASAASGNALVDSNTNAGSAKTGDGKTNITVLNLTGREVVAANSLLVFVNVLGQWVGLIVDAPAGTTAAALGTGVSQNRTRNLNADIDNTINSSITNDVDLSAQSGDASVRDNTNAGGATSGDATASANITNMLNSSFALSDWFGILFINVFGTWNGSFGVDTAAGGMAGRPSNNGSSSGSGGVAVFRFVPGSGDDGRMRLSPASLGGSGGVSDEPTGEVLGATTSNHTSGPTFTTSAVDISPQESGRNYSLIVGGLGLGAALILGERYLTMRRARGLV